MDHFNGFNGDRFLEWLFSDRMERRMTRLFILVSIIFLINLMAGVFR
jgi:hypothetical protein